MDIDSIKPNIKEYIAKYFDGFNDFNFTDNLVNMGITTQEFLFSLIQFIEKTFAVKIYQHELYSTGAKKEAISIEGIAKLITKKKQVTLTPSRADGKSLTSLM